MANYTYANSEDMLNHWTVPEDSTDPTLDKGPSTADIRHNFVGSAAWTIPFENVVLRDWNVSGVVTARSGLPYNITTGDDRNGTGQGDARPGGRNTGRTGPYRTLDFSLTRVIPLRGKHISRSERCRSTSSTIRTTPVISEISPPGLASVSRQAGIRDGSSSST